MVYSPSCTYERPGEKPTKSYSTTSTQTHSIANWVSHLFGFAESSPFVELPVRVICFLLNLASNAVMWVLFTKALAAATSSTRVSVLNVSANFFVTAILGMLIFSEGLPLGWWLGASLLVAGSVVIGAREGAQENEQSAEPHGTAVHLDSTVKGAGVATGGVAQSAMDAKPFKDDSEDEDAAEGDDTYYDEVDDAPEASETSRRRNQ